MSRVDNLINRYDYERILYKRVDELFNISRGKVISKDYIKENQGDYPVYSSQTENNGVLGHISTYAYDGEYLTWTTDGANAGTVFFRSGRFSVTNVCGLLEVINSTILNAKYAFYILNMIAPNYVNRGMGNPKLMSNVMGKIKLPVPPLPIQEEIVRILDSFKEHIAELTAELTARKKQYEYYIDHLLSFGDDVQRVKLSNVCKKIYSGATPLKSNREFYEGGTIPWIRTQDVKFNEINTVNSFITELAIKETTVKWIPENCVIVAISGATAGRCAINKIKATTNQHCLCLEIDSSIADYKYVFYCVLNNYRNLIEKKQGARGDLNSSIIKNIEIPLPSIKEQRKIVNILSRLDSLCNDISIGIPAEIDARKKQYEYYRDKLFNF